MSRCNTTTRWEVVFEARRPSRRVSDREDSKLYFHRLDLGAFERKMLALARKFTVTGLPYPHQ
jgi:hypothetical protein